VGVVLRLDHAQLVEVCLPVGDSPVLHSNVRHVYVGAAHVRSQCLAELGDPGSSRRATPAAMLIDTAAYVPGVPCASLPLPRASPNALRSPASPRRDGHGPLQGLRERSRLGCRARRERSWLVPAVAHGQSVPAVAAPAGECSEAQALAPRVSPRYGRQGQKAAWARGIRRSVPRWSVRPGPGRWGQNWVTGPLRAAGDGGRLAVPALGSVPALAGPGEGTRGPLSMITCRYRCY
jgi:hypothetical protein